MPLISIFLVSFRYVQSPDQKGLRVKFVKSMKLNLKYLRIGIKFIIFTKLVYSKNSLIFGINAQFMKFYGLEGLKPGDL